jgi:DNA primase
VGKYSEVIVVEGLFDLAVLWQAGFGNTTCALGSHLTPIQFSQLSDRPDRQVFLAFDADRAGQEAARSLAQRLQRAGRRVRIVDLPAGQDPNAYFVAGASPAEFENRLRHARCP